jgi:GT2 family glycosyltransferase
MSGEVTSRPRFSVFTASHNPRWLDECFESVVAQSASDWEWIVVLNGGAQWAAPRAGYRVMVIDARRELGVGEAKGLACEWASGEFLVELDHDDLLAPDALERIGDAFEEHPEAVLVYSHWAQILEDGSADESRFSAASGWEYRAGSFDGRSVTHAIALPPTPHNVAFRAAAYEAVGGYDRSLDILDDQDLMARLYLRGAFVLIDRCLYLQRMHENNTHRDGVLNERIQRETVALYDTYFERAALAWAQRSGLTALEVRLEGEPTPGYPRVDGPPRLGMDVWDLAAIPDGSVGVIRAQESLPLTDEPVALFNELYRVLAPGGVLITVSHSTDGRGAFQDPRARSYWNENSFWYYTEDAYRDRIPEIEARFQVSRAVTTFPSDWHEARDLSYVFVNLIAIKDSENRHGGALLVTPPEPLGASR